MRYQLPQQLPSLAPQLVRTSSIDRDPRDIAAWPRQARDNAAFDRKSEGPDDGIVVVAALKSSVSSLLME
jgi:hypothetical protein